jgi:mRNA interferase HicA
MKKRELLKRLRSEAARQRIDLVLIREGANHEVWRFGTQRLVIPRHNEINEHTARSILEHARKADDYGTHGD